MIRDAERRGGAAVTREELRDRPGGAGGHDLAAGGVVTVLPRRRASGSCGGTGFPPSREHGKVHRRSSRCFREGGRPGRAAGLGSRLRGNTGGHRRLPILSDRGVDRRTSGEHDDASPNRRLKEQTRCCPCWPWRPLPSRPALSSRRIMPCGMRRACRRGSWRSRAGGTGQAEWRGVGVRRRRISCCRIVRGRRWVDPHEASGGINPPLAPPFPGGALGFVRHAPSVAVGATSPVKRGRVWRRDALSYSG